MKIQVQCPLCSAESTHDHTDPASLSRDQWGSAIRLGDFAAATKAHGQLSVPSRKTFWCPCGRAVWMELQGWLISFDFIMRLAKAIRTLHPEDYQRIAAILTVEMPREISAVLTNLHKEPSP